MRVLIGVLIVLSFVGFFLWCAPPREEAEKKVSPRVLFDRAYLGHHYEIMPVSQSIGELKHDYWMICAIGNDLYFLLGENPEAHPETAGGYSFYLREGECYGPVYMPRKELEHDPRRRQWLKKQGIEPPKGPRPSLAFAGKSAAGYMAISYLQKPIEKERGY